MDDQTNKLGNKTREAEHRISAASSEAAATAKSKARDLTQTTKTRAFEEIEARKGGVSDELHRLGRALDVSAREVSSEGESMLSAPLRQIADFCKGASSTLSQRGPRQLFNDIEDLGRRQPAVFFGAALAAGFLATRLFRSDDASLDDEPTWPGDYDSARAPGQERSH